MGDKRKAQILHRESDGMQHSCGKSKGQSPQGNRCRFSINENARLRQMPTSWAYRQLSYLIIQHVNPVPGLVVKGNSPINSILQVNLSPHEVLSTW